MVTPQIHPTEEAASTAATGEHSASYEAPPAGPSGADTSRAHSTRYARALDAARELIHLTGSAASAKQVIDHLGR